MRARGELSSVWFMLAANTFFCDSPERWTEAADRVSETPPAITGARKNDRKIFLAGSPIFFPNFKVPLLIEEAGLTVAADDLCSSERTLPGAVAPAGTSQFELMQALAQRYHQGCICPTFIDNDRRINNIIGRRSEADFRGVLFHVLKGCHPYDLEGWGLENGIRNAGLKFTRIETDYAAEDAQNLLTRLEAFRATLEDD
jgi:benzoyl-CoA reductase/2-hydroxyglutaryl-CoA dehydratase subunit BcrC/BadD/HgdB